MLPRCRRGPAPPLPQKWSSVLYSRVAEELAGASVSEASRMISRFAPSTTGEAHPGTLLAALLVWLDARSRGGRVMLRLEDLDVTRTKAAWAEQMIDACRWLGLSWDEVVVQSDRRAA